MPARAGRTEADVDTRVAGLDDDGGAVDPVVVAGGLAAVDSVGVEATLEELLDPPAAVVFGFDPPAIPATASRTTAAPRPAAIL